MKRKLWKSFAILFCLLFAVACAVLYIYIYVIPGISGALTQTAILSFESRRVSVPARCIVVRSEEVILAEQAGSISYYVEENVKTRKNTKVLDVYPSGGSAKGYTLPVTGVVSYYIDGYESYFTPSGISDIDPAWAYQLEAVGESIVRTYTQEGQPLYKVISSDTWYMALIMDAADAEKFSEKQSISVVFGPDEERSVRARISSIQSKGNKWLITAETRRYFEDFVWLRTCDVSVISRSYDGLNVPISALCTDEDGNEGVKVKQIDGSYKFVRVKVLVRDEDSAVVKQTEFTETDEDGNTVTVPSVKLYDEVLRDSDDEI